MRKLVLILCLSAWAATAADLYTFSVLPPDGAVQGAPGDTVGWGYALQNQSSTLWLVPTDLNAGKFLNGTPDPLFDFPDLAPGTSVMKDFDPTSSSGLYQLTWDASAPLGFVNAGKFVLSAQWWSGNPQAGGIFVSDAPSASAAYKATVTAVPEPSTLGLTALAGLGLLAAGACRRNSASPLIERCKKSASLLTRLRA